VNNCDCDKGHVNGPTCPRNYTVDFGYSGVDLTVNFIRINRRQLFLAGPHLGGAVQIKITWSEHTDDPV